MNDALTRRLLRITADHHQRPMLMTGHRHVCRDPLAEEVYDDALYSMENNMPDIMNDPYDRSEEKFGVTTREEVIVVVPGRLNREQVIKLHICTDSSDMLNHIENNTRRLRSWLKGCFSGSEIPWQISRMQKQYMSGLGKSPETVMTMTATGIEGRNTDTGRNTRLSFYRGNVAKDARSINLRYAGRN